MSNEQAKVRITGTLQEVKRRKSGAGNEYITANLKRVYESKGEQVSEIFPFVIFSKSIEFAQKKGLRFVDDESIDAVFSLSGDKYTDKNGITRYSVKLIMWSAELSGEQPTQSQPDAESETSGLDDNDDLPF